MSTCHLLYLGPSRLSTFSWQKGQLLAEGEFTDDEIGSDSFRSYLAQRKNSRFLLLANTAEEAYRIETIPLLGGGDRRAVIARKISQIFPDTGLCAHFSLGREKTERRNEKLLISALTSPTSFQPWLEAIGKAEVALGGIYTTAQLGGPLLKALGYDTQRCLLLSLLHHSIRESHIANGLTIFSRLAAVGGTNIDALAHDLVAEAGKLQHYLIGQRHITRDETLPVFIIAHPQTIPGIKQACRDIGNPIVTCIDSHLAAQRLKLETPPEDNSSDQLFLQLLATQPPGTQFASKPLRHDFRLMQMRRALFALSGATLLSGAVGAANENYQAHLLDTETRQHLENAANTERAYWEMAATFPQLEISHETLRRVTNQYSELIGQQRHLAPHFEWLAGIMEQVPEIELENIDWQIIPPRPTADAGNPAVKEQLTLNGSILPKTEESPRQVLAIFGQFTTLLRAVPDCTLAITTPPFVIDSLHPLTASSEDDRPPAGYRFSLSITRQQ